jgi:hypothetical protein
MAMLCCFACRSQPTIFISASFVPSLLVGYRKVYSARREADVVMSSVTAGALSQDCVGDRAPPRRIDTPHVYRKALTSDQRGQRKAIHLVYAPIYDEISHDAEYHQKVQANIEEVMVEQKTKAAKGCVHEPAGSDEQEPTMEFGPFPPIDSQRNDHAKDDHVVERDRQKSICAALMELNCVKSCHDNSYGDSQRNHHRGEPGSKPSKEAMPAHFLYADQRGLGDEEAHPTRECGAVNPEQEGPRHGGMKEIVVDRTAEAPHHKHGEKQRHREIEISVHEPFDLGHRAASFFSDRCRPDMFRFDDGEWHIKILICGAESLLARLQFEVQPRDLRLVQPEARGSIFRFVTSKTTDVSGKDPIKWPPARSTV